MNLAVGPDYEELTRKHQRLVARLSHDPSVQLPAPPSPVDVQRAAAAIAARIKSRMVS